MEQKRGADLATARHIVYICNSRIYDMPVMDNKFYQGRKLDDLAMEIKDKGICLSVIAPRKIPALLKLYEKAGGDMKVAKEKNFAQDPRHLVLLSGFALQERPITPKPASVSPSLLQDPLVQFQPAAARVTTPAHLPSQSPEPGLKPGQKPGQMYRPPPPQLAGGYRQAGPITSQQPGQAQNILGGILSQGPGVAGADNNPAQQVRMPPGPGQESSPLQTLLQKPPQTLNPQLSNMLTNRPQVPGTSLNQPPPNQQPPMKPQVS